MVGGRKGSEVHDYSHGFIAQRRHSESMEGYRGRCRAGLLNLSDFVPLPPATKRHLAMSGRDPFEGYNHEGRF